MEEQVLSLIQNFIFKRRVVAVDFLAQEESPARLSAGCHVIAERNSCSAQRELECESFRWESKGKPKAKASRRSTGTAFEAPTLGPQPCHLAVACGHLFSSLILFPPRKPPAHGLYTRLLG
jgi:hypothetical protein